MNVQAENEGDEMEYNNHKSTRRSRRARKEKTGKNGGGGEQKGERDNDISKENNGDDGLIMETTSHSVAENERNGKQEADSLAEDNRHTSNQRGDKKSIARSEANSKSKNSSKGKKTKVELMEYMLYYSPCLVLCLFS